MKTRRAMEALKTTAATLVLLPVCLFLLWYGARIVEAAQWED